MAGDVAARVVRNTAIVSGMLAAAALAWQPDRPRIGLGVVGGAALVGLAYWSLRGLVAQATAGGETGGTRPVSGARQLVKFFTRHAILALAAYGMMLRLHLDPVGMLVGVAAVTVAAAVEAGARRRP